MTNYYNENDPKAAAWLRELIRGSLIAPGIVDERSIEDVEPGDLGGFTQCHFFAGIGGWSYALRLAGWPDDRPVWTGSCPCQPFSTAGKGKGSADERHLWPAWFWLISQCRPDVIFGEQVEAAIRHGWLDLVSSDLEGEGYHFGAIGLPACGVGAPHIRQRLWFVADTNHQRSQGRAGMSECSDEQSARSGSMESGLADTDRKQNVATDPRGLHAEPRSEGGDGRLAQSKTSERGQLRNASEFMSHAQTRRSNSLGGMGHPGSSRRQPQPPIIRIDGEGVGSPRGEQVPGIEAGSHVFDEQPATGPTNGFWGTADWLFCRDDKWRPVEPGTFPLADGLSERVGLLRGYGNAIVPQVAAEVIKAYMEVRNG